MRKANSLTAVIATVSGVVMMGWLASLATADFLRVRDWSNRWE